MMRKKPMLAYPVSDKPIDYTKPTFIQPKLDGVRCLIQNEKREGYEIVVAYSRTGKVWKNINHILGSLRPFFDKYQNAKMILGHLGESIPFSLWRINQALNRIENTGGASFREIFSKHFWITTSGNFSNPALLCCMMEIGIDRIMFSVDYPFVENNEATSWIPTIPLCEEDISKLLHKNAETLLKL